MQVEALAVKLTQKEGELIQEKFEVKKLANFLKQVGDVVKFAYTLLSQMLLSVNLPWVAFPIIWITKLSFSFIYCLVD